MMKLGLNSNESKIKLLQTIQIPVAIIEVLIVVYWPNYSW